MQAQSSCCIGCSLLEQLASTSVQVTSFIGLACTCLIPMQSLRIWIAKCMFLNGEIFYSPSSNLNLIFRPPASIDIRIKSGSNH